MRGTPESQRRVSSRCEHDKFKRELPGLRAPSVFGTSALLEQRRRLRLVPAHTLVHAQNAGELIAGSRNLVLDATGEVLARGESFQTIVTPMMGTEGWG